MRVFVGGFNDGVVQLAVVEELVGFLGCIRRLEFEADAIVFVVVVVQVFFCLQEPAQLLQDLQQDFIGLDILENHDSTRNLAFALALNYMLATKVARRRGRLHVIVNHTIFATSLLKGSVLHLLTRQIGWI